MFRFVRSHPLSWTLVVVVLVGLGFWARREYRHWRAERHFQAAQERTAAFRYEAAYEHIRQAVALHADRADIQFFAARAARRVLDMPAAKGHLNACEKRLGETAEIRLEKQLWAIQRGDADDLAEYTVWRRAESDHQNRAVILEALLRGALASNRLHHARTAVEKWLEEATEDARPYFWRAVVYEEIHGDFERLALKDYELSLEKDPDFNECRLRLAELRLTRLDAPGALPHFKELHRRLPDNPDATIGLARCLLRLGENDAARGLLDGILAQDGSNVSALRERGILAMVQGEFEPAEAWLRKAHDRDPHEMIVSYNLYLCLQGRGKDRESLEQLANYETTLAKRLRLQQLLHGDLVARPNDPKLLCEIATLYMDTCRPEKADLVRVWLERALQADATYKPTFAAFADYYDRTNRPALAAQFRAKAN